MRQLFAAGNGSPSNPNEIGVDVTVKSVISRVARLGIDAIDEAVSPRGNVLYGVKCGPEKCWEVWKELRDALADEYGWWPFISHDGPGEWEWAQPGGEADLPHEHHRETLTRLVTAQSDILEGAEDLASRLGELAPRHPGVTIGAVFARPPEWVCAVAAPECSRLPEILEAPSTPNWIGGPDHPALTYRDHVDVLHAWHRQYDASICYLGANSLMLEVGRPPQTARDVAAVAIEQYAYCYDLDQIFGSIEEVAREQASSPQWFFRWD
ncbi:DUF4253 domain-containing protein [Streptomyces sp. NPDC014864]|uniref:DUF4253 domain-containing protein n=1 Tax=Streptomyces sp. NPDC014864 TaxID=3364924 RepID=UPI0036F53E53